MSKLSTPYETLFPYDEPRDSQIDGMNTIGEAAETGGIVTMEGACGTGKTLTALVPYLSHVRNSSSDAERVLIVTSVKQQMEAFQDEVTRINNSLSDGVRPITALTLVGLPDVHPFVEQDVITDNPYERIDTLRENARNIVADYDCEYEDLYHNAADLADNNDQYAYPDYIPTYEDIEYDPYYAKYRAKHDPEESEVVDIIPFDTQYAGLITVDVLRDICGRQGLCPHSMMRLALDHVDLVIGNYMHAFDPVTVKRMTNPIIDEGTLAVFDEAHNLVPRVREFLSKQSSVGSLTKTQDELTEVALLAELGRYDKETVKQIAQAVKVDESASTTVSGHEETIETIQYLIGDVSGSLVSSLDSIDEFMSARDTAAKLVDSIDLTPEKIREYRDYLDSLTSVVSEEIERNQPLTEDDSIQLRDPEDPQTDKLTDWTQLNTNYSGNPMKKAGEIGAVVGQVRDEVIESSDTAKSSARATGDVLSDWYEKDHIHYYRSIEIEPRYDRLSSPEYRWQEDFRAELKLHNCIPRDEIAEALETFDSTVLMSATLEPMDVYHHTTGIAKLEEEGRPVYKCRYGLAFPDENRVTLGVPATKFKYDNRGPAFTKRGANTDNPTREEYRDTLMDIVNSTPGNVLIVMPSYTEAEWIGSILEKSYWCDVDEVFIDESSSNRETTELKEDFFNSDNSVLVTGARGTLIEGVDYIGDRLSATVVCGVPIMNTTSDYKQAIKAAYDTVFEDMEDVNGFTLAFTIPAVWKARQSIGRVIRTKEDIGARILMDERYMNPDAWDSVHNYLSPSEQDEMRHMQPEDVEMRLDAFWEMHDINK